VYNFFQASKKKCLLIQEDGGCGVGDVGTRAVYAVR
jgi:hypothetical protein